MPRPSALLPALLVASALTGCGDLFSDRARTKPRREAVVGTWTLDTPGCTDERDAEALARVKAEPSIVLDADGTFSARDFPDWNSGFGRSGGDGGDAWPSPELYTGSGTWDLHQNQDTWVVRLNFRSLPAHPQGLGLMIDLYNQNPPYRLGHELDDPDAFRRLIFHQSGRGTKKSVPAPKLRKVRPAVEHPPEA